MPSDFLLQRLDAGVADPLRERAVTWCVDLRLHLHW
jgi:hypothetical protein